MPTGWERTTSRPPDAVNERSAESSANVSLKGEDIRANEFIPEQPEYSLDDIVLSRLVRSRIETALARIRFHEKLYHEWNLKKIDPHGSRTALNFFGPPGTGKTMCAEAIAHHLRRSIIRVNYAEIESKYVGETPKNVTAAFRRAKDTGSVLFFDEADSILGRRLTQVTQAADHSVNLTRSVMLLQLDRFDGVVIFATNMARNYDTAFVRRILAHVQFDLPDAGARESLWRLLIPAETSDGQ